MGDTMNDEVILHEGSIDDLSKSTGHSYVILTDNQGDDRVVDTYNRTEPRPGPDRLGTDGKQADIKLIQEANAARDLGLHIDAIVEVEYIPPIRARALGGVGVTASGYAAKEVTE